MAKEAPVLQAAMNRTALLKHLSEATGTPKKDVAAVLDELTNVIGSHVAQGAPGTFILSGLLKVKTVVRPAQKARKGVPNPFKPGETMDVKARPASVQVKVLALKKLKDMAK